MFAAAAALVVGLADATAHPASQRQACMTAAEQAQSLRDSGKYVEARKQLLVCTRDVCPAFVKKDCGEWLAQLESVAPSVVLAAKDGSRDLLDVKVYIDGKLVLEKLDGTPIPMDTGPHSFKFEWAGQTKVEDAVISAGQRGRNIVATFGTVAAAPAPAPAPTPPPVTRTDEKPRRGSLVPALVVGGVGVLGLASFTVFGLMGRSEESDLRASCKPRCASDRVDSARTKYLVGDISLGVGLVGLGVATYMILTRPTVRVEPAPPKTGFRSIELDLGPTLAGASGSLRARF